MKKIRRILTLALSVFMLGGTMVQTAEAADEPIDITTYTYGLPEEEAVQKAYAMKIASNELTSWPQGPATYGEGAIVMEAKSGAILYAKNMDGKGYPASITKILTALIALENGKLDDTITITDDSIAFLEYGDAHIGLAPGEEISLHDALYALLLASANEVAYAIADNVGESYEWFLSEMNNRAKELGAVNTNFTNTNGLPDENHYTTCHDMALITRELLENHEEFKTISQTLQYTIPATNLCGESRTFQQVHKMFYEWEQYYYPNAVAGKTGYTDAAMNTLVTCADDGNLELICVVLKTHGRNVYTDTASLLDYGFQNFKKVSIEENEDSQDFKKIEKGSYVVLPEGVAFRDLKSEITEDAEDRAKGTVTYTWEDNPVGSAKVTFSKAYLKAHDIEIPSLDKGSATSKKSGADWKKIIWIVAVVLIVLLVIRMVMVAIVRRKKREARRRRRIEAERARRQMMRQQNEGYQNVRRQSERYQSSGTRNASRQNERNQNVRQQNTRQRDGGYSGR